MKCPKCGTNNPPEEQLTYCRKCGTELRVVCPRCSADNAGNAEHCTECGLELHPDRGHERAAGIRKDPDLVTVAGVIKKPTMSGGVLAIGVVTLLIVWFPIVVALRQRAQLNDCQSNLRKLAVALSVYARDSGGVYPDSNDWNESLSPYLRDRNTLACPSRSDKVGYAFNFNLNEFGAGSVPSPSTTIAFFDAKGGENVNGMEEIWLKSAAHWRGNNIVFLNGSTKVLREVPGRQYWGYAMREGIAAPTTPVSPTDPLAPTAPVAPSPPTPVPATEGNPGAP